ncbi:unnamed protein product [Peniophora sp. CBMAI 1063]|nr:unnamed protein product [Peniophora sp. CBMAI 1063]
MTNYDDPTLIATETVNVTKSLHVLAGLITWEFLNFVDFDWSMIVGKRPRKWTFWVYMGCRVFPLIEAAFTLRALDHRPAVNCLHLHRAAWAFGTATFICSSLIILMRLFAVWRQSVPIRVLATAVWVTNIPLAAINIPKLQALPDPFTRTSCIVPNAQVMLVNFVFFLGTEVSLSFVTLYGLWRLRDVARGNIWRLMYRQGWLWPMLAISMQTPTVVILALNLNGALNIAPLTPGMNIMAIAAGRLYRSLILTATEATVRASAPRSGGRGKLSTRRVNSTPSPCSSQRSSGLSHRPPRSSMKCVACDLG